MDHFFRQLGKSFQIHNLRADMRVQSDNFQVFSFGAAKEHECFKIAFGHHKDDSNQTLLMNLLHKGEFAANLPKVMMHDYGVEILRPLIYAEEAKIIEFAKIYGFLKITCQCPVGQNSLRKKTKLLIQQLEKTFPNTSSNLFQASLNYGSHKAQKK